MTDADELAQRYLTLWTQYLTALLADPRTLETLKRWASLASRFSYPAAGEGQTAGAPFSAWPPLLAPFGMPASPPPVAEATAQITVLTRRIDDLERRLAVLERQSEPHRSPVRTKRAGRGRASSPKSS